MQDQLPCNIVMIHTYLGNVIWALNIWMGWNHRRRRGSNINTKHWAEQEKWSALVHENRPRSIPFDICLTPSWLSPIVQTLYYCRRSDECKHNQQVLLVTLQMLCHQFDEKLSIIAMVTSTTGAHHKHSIDVCIEEIFWCSYSWYNVFLTSRNQFSTKAMPWR